MKQYSLRKRLVVGTWLLLIVALLPPYLYFDKTLRRDVLLEAKARAAEDVDTTYWLLREHPPFPSYRHLNGWVTELSRRTGTRITYIVDGHVTADSDVPYERLSTLEDHANRPEVVEARSGTLGTDVRFSATLGKDLIYAARKVDGIAGLDPGTLRLALPLSVVHDRLDRMEKGLVWAFLFSLLASGALGLLVTRPLLRGMETMAMAAQAIGQGEFGRRIRDIPGRELRPLAHAINGMAHNIEQHLHQLNEQKGRLEAVFNGMHEGVMVLDATGRIDSMNRALTAMFTGIGNKLGATPLEATMKPELQRLVDEMLVSPDPRGASMQTDLGEGRAFEISLVPFRDASGQRMVLVFHDISEREKLEHIRRDFVANVSHELKTPLTSIKGYAETLLEGPPASPGQMSAFLRTILKNANHMTKMVNSLLVLARSEHKGDKVALTGVDAAEVLRQTLRELEPVAARKEIVLENGVGATPLPVLADRDGLVEVFRNLLDNAIKYSPPRTRVGVSATAADGRVTLCVSDQGPGIPEKSRERIFERFYRLDRDGDGAKNGSAGLGLAICRRIVMSHGGDIWVESPLDAATRTGAAFFVMLFAPRPDDAEDAEDAEGEEPDGHAPYDDGVAEDASMAAMDAAPEGGPSSGTATPDTAAAPANTPDDPDAPEESDGRDTERDTDGPSGPPRTA
ncbi:sensor histidine kinase [Nitratidesulfovibrio sp. 1201_IL3209]|uniref:sensor histidine kinase n=1 Tax=Nitratidesulfovibrio sp. 1201_IL3209 TaxID=3084053 RepID=UPI002FD9A2C0